MNIVETERIIVKEFEKGDAHFILSVLNTPAWLKYIGDRKVKSIADARKYIQTGPFAKERSDRIGLRSIYAKDEDQIVGMCGFLMREYLDAPDLGFALHPHFFRKGYALEACTHLLEWGSIHLKHSVVYAITKPDNASSRHLLLKLEFSEQKTMLRDDELLMLYQRNL